MLKGIYVDNFRSLVNFQVDFEPLTLLLGPNGTGKSALFEALRRLRDFVAGVPYVSESYFPSSTLTAWQRNNTQTFELSLDAPTGTYRYSLEIWHERAESLSSVQMERLSHNERPLYDGIRKEGQLWAQLYGDDGSRGPDFLADWSRSALSLIPERNDNKLLTAFKRRIDKLIVAHFEPALMSARAEDESPNLTTNASNFVSWFRFAHGLDTELISKLKPILSDVLPGYQGFRLLPDGERAKLLKVKLSSGGEPVPAAASYESRFDELSDGQRVLVALYALLETSDAENTLCLDEPENFVALREIQPWLNALIDKTQAGECQAILISHHPELINVLAASSGRWLDRTAGGATCVQPIADDGTGLQVSELVARGWLNA